MASVSVLIPAYNREHYLEEAARSVLTQTYSDLELIIINDASTDITGTIAEQIAKQDARVRVLHHTHNKLRSGALNTGIAAAQGTYISILDSDDIYMPDKLERQVSFLESHPETDGVYGDFATFSNGSEKRTFVEALSSTANVRKNLIARAAGNDAPIMSEGFIPSCSALIRATVFAQLRFDESLRNAEDLDMWLSILGAGFTLEHLPGNTYIYRKHVDQKSSNLERMKTALAVINAKIASGAYLSSKT